MPSGRRERQPAISIGSATLMDVPEWQQLDSIPEPTAQSGCLARREDDAIGKHWLAPELDFLH